jgi:gliding motility-associated lipoprotein GldJ
LAGQDAGIFSGTTEDGSVAKPIKGQNMLGKKPLTNFAKAKKKDQKRYKVNMEDGIFLPEYRLPTEAEWEYAAQANIGNTQFSNVDDKKIYSWNEYTIRIKDGNEKDRGKIRMNVMRAKGDNAGLAGGDLNDAGMITTPVFSYWPNSYGLYNMNGNVSEWVMDVFRPLSLEDMDGFMPFRGNKFENPKLDQNGPNGLSEKDELGRLVYEDVTETKIKEGGRRNYSKADNIGYRDVENDAKLKDEEFKYEY